MDPRIPSAISGVAAVGLSLLNKAPTVYSFMDLSGSMTHPLVGSYLFTGQGVGSITITMDNDKTFHEIDVYGTVLVGKVPNSNSGKIMIACQQSSNLNSWLGATYNTIRMEKAQEWARLNFLLRNVHTGDSFSAFGVTFSNFPEEPYIAQGSMLNWSLSFANMNKFYANPTGAGQMSALQKAVQSIV